MPVRSCQRRGVAIDLVLDRPRENRSQLVLHPHPRRPRRDLLAIRAHHPPSPPRDPRPPPPRRLSSPQITIVVDSRERYPYKFAQQQASTERRALPAGDYGTKHDGNVIAVVERKSLDDLVRRLIDGQLTYAIADLATLPRAAVVVEDRYSSLFNPEYAQPGFVTETARHGDSALPDRSDPLQPRHGNSPRNGPTASSAPRSPTTKPTALDRITRG